MHRVSTLTHITCYSLHYCILYAVRYTLYAVFVNKSLNIYPIPTGELAFDSSPTLLSWR